MCQYTETYTYDDAGNMLSMQQEPLHTIGVSGWTRKLAYNHPNRIDLTQCNNALSSCELGGETEMYQVNSTGCMTTMPKFSTLEWDWNDKLRSSSRQIVKDDKTPETAFYVYNSDGERVRKVTERYSPNTGPMGTRKVKETVTVFGASFYAKLQSDGITKEIDQATSEVELQGQVIYTSEFDFVSFMFLPRFIPDQQLELDDVGQLIHYEEFFAFGSSTYVASESDIEASRKYRFASYEQDSETGLYFCDTRYLAPWLGRWISPDALLYEDGLNLYTYVENDPINFFDPEGTAKRKVRRTTKTTAPSKASKVIRKSWKNFMQKPKMLDERPRGDKHHLFQQKYRRLFHVLRIDVHKKTMHVDSTINRSEFRKTHDKKWGKFWNRKIEAAKTWSESAKGKANTVVQNLVAKTRISQEEFDFGITEEYLKRSIGNSKPKLTALQNEAFDQFTKNMSKTQLPLGEVEDYIGTFVGGGNMPDEPMLLKSEYNNIREKLYQKFLKMKAHQRTKYVKQDQANNRKWCRDNGVAY